MEISVSPAPQPVVEVPAPAQAPVPAPVRAPAQPKTNQFKLIWVGGVCAVLVGGVVIYSLSSGTNKSTQPATNVSNAAVGANAVAAPAPVATPAVNEGVAANWLPEYPGATPEVLSSVQTPDGEQNVSRFKTDDAPTKVVAYFQDQLKRQGFTIQAASSGQDSGSLQAEDGSRKRSLVLSVNVVPDEKGSFARVVTVAKK